MRDWDAEIDTTGAGGWFNVCVFFFPRHLEKLLTRVFIKPFETVETEKVHVDAHGRIRMAGSKANGRQFSRKIGK